jgi:hypothetical protein
MAGCSEYNKNQEKLITLSDDGQDGCGWLGCVNARTIGSPSNGAEQSGEDAGRHADNEDSTTRIHLSVQEACCKRLLCVTSAS